MIPSLALFALLSVTTGLKDDPYFKALTAACYDGSLACFVPGFCKFGADAVTKKSLIHVKQITIDQADVAQRCPTIAAFKKFNDRKWLVLLFSDGFDAQEKKAIEFQINGGQLFGCRSDDGSTVVVQPGTFTSETLYKTVRKTELFCKFTVTGKLHSVINVAQKQLALKINSYSYEITANEAYPIIANTGKCDASRLQFHVKSLDASETSLWPLVEFDNVRCPDGSKLKLLKDGKAFDGTIECTGSRGAYKLEIEDAASKAVSPTMLHFACTTKTCTRCGDIDLPQGSSGALKPKFTAASGDQCADLACENDRIQLPGANATVAKPYCKQFAEGDFRWTIAAHGEERAFLEVTCPNTVKCNDVQPISGFCESPACSQMSNTWLNKVYCEGGHQIASKPEGGVWSLITSVNCNDKTGVWMKVAQGQQPVKLEPNEKIKCLTSEEVAALRDQGIETTTQNSDTAPSTGGGPFPIGGYIAIVFVVVIIMLIIFGFAFYKIHKRKKAEEDAIEVDAKPPTPPASAGDSEAAGGSGAEVSFSGTKREQQTPSLKSAKTDWASAPKQFAKAELPQQPASAAAPVSITQTFEAAVSVTAPITDISDGTSGKPTPPPAPSDKSIPKPADPSSSGPKPSSDVSKKKLKELLDQSLPSMSE